MAHPTLESHVAAPTVPHPPAGDVVRPHGHQANPALKDAVQRASMLRDRYVTPRLTWYTEHKRYPFFWFRFSGVLIVLLGVSLPGLTRLTIESKDALVSLVGIAIAALTGLMAFFHWDRTWRSRAQAEQRIQDLVAQWELKLWRAEEEPDPAVGVERIVRATEELLRAAGEVTAVESEDFFKSVKPVQQS